MCTQVSERVVHNYVLARVRFTRVSECASQELVAHRHKPYSPTQPLRYVRSRRKASWTKAVENDDQEEFVRHYAAEYGPGAGGDVDAV